VRLVIARCSVVYRGRLDAHLPAADRLVMVKADGSVSIHSDDRAYKPLNWMNPPCTITEEVISDTSSRWKVRAPKGEYLEIDLEQIHSDTEVPLGAEPGLRKDGVEAHLQAMLAERTEAIGSGFSLVRREYPTDIGPVDLLCRDREGVAVAVEVKRRGEIDGVEQLSRYLDFLNRDPRLAPVRGVFVAEQIRPQAKVLAAARGIGCVEVDYDELRGIESSELRLF
jgi:endonuclease